MSYKAKHYLLDKEFPYKNYFSCERFVLDNTIHRGASRCFIALTNPVVLKEAFISPIREKLEGHSGRFWMFEKGCVTVIEFDSDPSWDELMSALYYESLDAFDHEKLTLSGVLI
ncbi:MAG: hypothetical protein ACTSR2_00105 [Candidatus Hodarchaeales archaeon]